MNEDIRKHVQSVLGDLAREIDRSVPDYGFTVEDYMAEIERQGIEPLTRDQAYRRLERKTARGELIKIKVSGFHYYYVPKELAHMAKLDENVLKDSD